MTHLDHYLSYASFNESPKVYHTWTAISLFSHVIGRRVWTDMKAYIAYPHLYVCLVGHPGIAKGAAMRIPKTIIKDHFSKITICAASQTRESIIQTMGKDDSPCINRLNVLGKPYQFSQMAIFANEMVSLLNAGGNPLGIIDFLTDVWDQEIYDDATKNRGTHVIVHPYLSILGCFTTETAKSLMSSKIITGGMSRRCIFAYADRNEKPVPFPEHTPEQLESYDNLVKHLKSIQSIIGPFTWEPAALAFYKDWYVDNAGRGERSTSEILKHFLRTKPEICIKVSMLLALAEENPSLQHTLRTFTKATELVSEVESGASILFDSSGRNELAELSQKVEVFLAHEQGSVTTKTLQVRFWADMQGGTTQDMDHVIAHLTRCGKITVTTDSQRVITWKN